MMIDMIDMRDVEFGDVVFGEEVVYVECC